MKTKQLLITLLSLISIGVYGQDSVFFNVKGDKVKSLKLANYYTVTIQDSAVNRKIERTYYMSGKLKLEKHLLERPNRNDPKKPFSHLDGKFRKWYENGQLWMDLNYEHNSLTGEIMTYWDNGQLKRHELFQRGKSIKGECYNREGESVEFFLFEEPPRFSGGIGALMGFLSRNIIYPVKMQQQSMEGKVIIEFLVDKDGKVINRKLIRNLTPEFDEEALRVTRLIPNWEPGKQDGDKVEGHYTLPIDFKLH